MTNAPDESGNLKPAKMKNSNETITNTSTENAIPVMASYQRKPLMHMGKQVTNSHGKQVMDDQWIYVDGGKDGMYSINVVRSEYCAMLNLKEVTIQESIGSKKLMSKKLQSFCENISDKLVFKYAGKMYRIYLKKVTSRTFDIAKIAPYWATTTLGQNKPIKVDGKFIMHAHELNVMSKFNF